MANWIAPTTDADIREQLLGPEVAGHPVWNICSKTPDNPLATVPWHQDTAYVSEGSEKTPQPTAWIPFLNADAINGALQLMRGGHRSGQVFPHHLERESPTAGFVSKGGSLYLEIDDGKLPDCEIVTVPVPFGSVLLLNQLFLTVQLKIVLKIFAGVLIYAINAPASPPACQWPLQPRSGAAKIPAA